MRTANALYCCSVRPAVTEYVMPLDRSCNDPQSDHSSSQTMNSEEGTSSHTRRDNPQSDHSSSQIMNSEEVTSSDTRRDNAYSDQ